MYRPLRSNPPAQQTAGRFQHHQAYFHGASGEELLVGLERSGKVPSSEKFRRMTCFTFVSTGNCPYGDRCVFLHDPRLQITGFKVKPTRNVRQPAAAKDTFYWPDQNRDDVSHMLDAQGLPDANQAYTIPLHFATDSTHSHDRALYSLWNHFVDACLAVNDKDHHNDHHHHHNHGQDNNHHHYGNHDIHHNNHNNNQYHNHRDHRETEGGSGMSCFDLIEFSDDGGEGRPEGGTPSYLYPSPLSLALVPLASPVSISTIPLSPTRHHNNHNHQCSTQSLSYAAMAARQSNSLSSTTIGGVQDQSSYSNHNHHNHNNHHHNNTTNNHHSHDPCGSHRVLWVGASSCDYRNTAFVAALNLNHNHSHSNNHNSGQRQGQGQGGVEGGGGGGGWMRNRHLAASCRLPVFAALGCGLALTESLTGNENLTGSLTWSENLTGNGSGNRSLSVLTDNDCHNNNHLATIVNGNNGNHNHNHNNNNTAPSSMSPPTGPQTHTTNATAKALSPPTRSTPPQPQSTPPHPQSTPSPPHPFDMHTLDLALNLDLALASTHLTDTMSPSLPPTTLPSSGWANIWDDTVPLGQAMNGSTKPYNTNKAVNSTSHVPPTTGGWMDDWLFQDQPFPSTPSQMAPVKPTPRQRGPSQNSYETCQHLYGPSQMHLYDTVKDPLMSSLSMDDNDDNVFASLQGVSGGWGQEGYTMWG